MRLIDADALLEHIKKLECHAENKKYEQGLNDFLQCYLPQIIDNQPTAYDVEKVVAEIEEYYEEAEQHRFASAISDIVEVVRNGGKE